jgi:hypothetical protein
MPGVSFTATDVAPGLVGWAVLTGAGVVARILPAID